MDAEQAVKELRRVVQAYDTVHGRNYYVHRNVDGALLLQAADLIEKMQRDLEAEREDSQHMSETVDNCRQELREAQTCIEELQWELQKEANKDHRIEELEAELRSLRES